MHEELVRYLEEEFKRFYIRSGPRVSQVDFARWLQIAPSDLSKYMTGAQQPGPKNQNKIAEKLGPTIYDVLGVPRRVPTGNKLLTDFVDSAIEFFPKFTRDEQLNLLDILNEKAERYKKADEEVLSKYE